MGLMDEAPTPEQLRTAARACIIMAYAVGVTGIAAGAILLRDGAVALAVIGWSLTFAVGACLMGIALLLRSFYSLAATMAWLRRDLREHESTALGSAALGPPESETAPSGRTTTQPRTAN